MVQITTGHLVSDSMVSRAYLKDTWSGLVVSDNADQFWLVSTRGVLEPDQAELKRRGHAAGGPSPASSQARFAKLDVDWFQASGRITDEEQLERKNPRIVCHPEGADIAVVLLGGVADVPQHMADSAPNINQPLIQPDSPELVVATTHQVEDGASWAVSLPCQPASSPGFGGEPGAVALALSLGPISSGSPAYSVANDSVSVDRITLEGLVRPLSAGLSVLLPAHLITETIAHAVASARE